jgi:hypothetical protein
MDVLSVDLNADSKGYQNENNGHVLFANSRRFPVRQCAEDRFNLSPLQW